jgi:hypothetical protein
VGVGRLSVIGIFRFAHMDTDKAFQRSFNFFCLNRTFIDIIE